MFTDAGPNRPTFVMPEFSDSSSSSEEEGKASKTNYKPDDSSDSDASHKNRQKKYKIPKFQYGHRTKKEIELLRNDFQNLKHHSDDTFRSLSITELIRLDSKLGKDSKSSKKLTEKLQKNHENAKKKPTQVKAGEDNRADLLHDARFLGGHTCKNEEIWLKARKTIGITGLDPIAHYDVDSVGMNDRMNSVIWAALHNPGSREISIRMLSPEALKAAMGNDDKETTSPKKDFDSILEIQIALATLRLATQFIHPWNLSVATLEFFMVSVNFGERDISDRAARIKFVCEFIDTILIRNAQAWDDSNGCWPAEKIANKWIGDLATKLPKTDQNSSYNNQKQDTSQKNQNQNIAKTPPKTGKNTNSKFAFKRIFVPTGVCKRYNLAICPHQNDASCQAPWDNTISLKHVCCHQNPQTKAFCLDKHTMTGHK